MLPSNRASENGGGAYVIGDGRTESPTTFVNCEITDNRANGWGGGIATARQARVYVNDCLIRGNRAGDLGGGICQGNTSHLFVNGSTIARNRATGGGGVSSIGSNIFLFGWIENSIITRNRARFGGGVYTTGLDHISDSVIAKNRATEGSGGGIVLGPARWLAVDVLRCRIVRNRSAGTGLRGGGGVNIDRRGQLVNCRILRNRAGTGGGVTATGGAMVGCTVARNLADDLGGGVFFDSYSSDNQSFRITSCTIADNEAENSGGGLYWEVQHAGDVAMLTNSVIWGNLAKTGRDITLNTYGAPDGTLEVNYSDYLNDDEHLLVLGGGQLIEGRGNIHADPQFTDPDAGDYTLAPGSPCIDAADNRALPVDYTEDLDGWSRWIDDPETRNTGRRGERAYVADMGAHEYRGLCQAIDGVRTLSPQPQEDIVHVQAVFKTTLPVGTHLHARLNDGPDRRFRINARGRGKVLLPRDGEKTQRICVTECPGACFITDAMIDDQPIDRWHRPD